MRDATTVARRSHARQLGRRRLRPAVASLALGAALLGQRAAAFEVPDTGGRLSVGGYLDGLAIVDTGGGPRQVPQGLLALRLDATAARWLRGHAEVRGRVGGPIAGGNPGAYSLVHEFPDDSPALEWSEAYADVLLSRADFRAGIQKVAWGKLDGIPPTDVVNPRDLHDPLVEEFEERKIGIPAVLGTYYLPDLPRYALESLRATLIWVPIVVPSRMALTDERWFPSSIAPGAGVHVPPSQVEALFGVFEGETFGAFQGLPVVDCDRPQQKRLPICRRGFTIPVTLRTANVRPPKRLDAGGIAVRLGGTWRSMDWDLYHYSGPETGPNADLLATAAVYPRRALALLAGAKRPPLTGAAELRQAHDSIHMTGADWSAALGGLTVRAEAAVFQDRPYPRAVSDLASLEALAGPLARISAAARDRVLSSCLQPGGSCRPFRAPVPLGDLFIDLDSVEWGIGADYLVNGFLPLVQLNQVVFLESAPRLLLADPETRFTASLRKRLMAERLELEVRGIYAIDRDYWFVFPRASYQVNDDLRVRVGYLAIGGARESILGQFRDNDEMVFQARYSF